MYTNENYIQSALHSVMSIAFLRLSRVSGTSSTKLWDATAAASGGFSLSSRFLSRAASRFRLRVLDAMDAASGNRDCQMINRTDSATPTTAATTSPKRTFYAKVRILLFVGIVGWKISYPFISPTRLVCRPPPRESRANNAQ